MLARKQFRRGTRTHAITINSNQPCKDCSHEVKPLLTVHRGDRNTFSRLGHIDHDLDDLVLPPAVVLGSAGGSVYSVQIQPRETCATVHHADQAGRTRQRELLLL